MLVASTRRIINMMMYRMKISKCTLHIGVFGIVFLALGAAGRVKPLSFSSAIPLKPFKEISRLMAASMLSATMGI